MSYTTFLWTSIAILIGGIGLSGICIIIATITDSAIAAAAGVILGAATLVAIGVWNVSATRASMVEKRINVVRSERVVDADGNSARYLVYTPNETFEDTDELLAFGKTNSSDLYGRLTAGQTYTCKVAGWRVHFFSLYRNIINCD